MSDTPIDLYDNVYADFASSAEAAVRRETYGEDLGQSSWLTASEWLGFADQLGVGAESEVLEVGSGSGGPAVFLAAARHCRVTGVDINEHGVRNAMALAQARGLADRLRFEVVDAGQPCRSPTRASTPSSRTTRCATSATGRRRSATGTGCFGPADARSLRTRWCSPAP